MECDAPNLPITGELPKALNGWLYRNGPNPQFAPRGPYHWFSGDGMLHAFHLENGRVAYRNRWVRTPKWELEHAEGEGLSGAFGNPRFSRPAHRQAGLDRGQHQRGLAWRPAAGAGGGACAVRGRPGDAGAQRLSRLRRQAGRADDRAPQDRRGAAARWCSSAMPPRAASRPTCRCTWSTPTARSTRSQCVPGALPEHGARLRRHARLDHPADLPAHRLDGAGDEGPAALRLGAGQGHPRGAGAAQRLGRPGALVQRRPLLCVPPDERLRHARRQGGVRHDEVPGGAAVPGARRPAGQRRAAGGHAGALDLRPEGQHRRLQRAAAGRPPRRVPAPGRALHRAALPPRLVPGRRGHPTPAAGATRATAWRTSTMPRGKVNAWHARARRPLRRAGVRAAQRHGGRRRRLRAQRRLPRRHAAAATWRCSTRSTCRTARWRWPTCRTACRPASTATGATQRPDAAAINAPRVAPGRWGCRPPGGRRPPHG